MRRNPSAVKVSRLGQHSLAIDRACIHPARVKRQVILQPCIPRRRRGITPRNVLHLLPAMPQVPITRDTLELAKASPLRCHAQQVHRNISLRKVVRRRMTRLEQPHSPRRVGNRNACVHDDNVPCTRLHPRWPRIVPYRLDPHLCHRSSVDFPQTAQKPHRVPECIPKRRS